MESLSGVQVLTGERLFQIAAIVSFISIGGHIKYGYDYFYKYLDVIPKKKEYALARYGAERSWNYINLTFFTSAALNWQWSYTNGPATMIEEAIFWVTVVLSIWGGFAFVKIGYYQPLIPLWIATSFSMLAFAVSANVRATPSLWIPLA